MCQTLVDHALDCLRHKSYVTAFPTDLEIAYVPSHLYHILFELMKNSMRAVMEYHGEDAGEYLLSILLWLPYW